MNTSLRTLTLTTALTALALTGCGQTQHQANAPEASTSSSSPSSSASSTQKTAQGESQVTDQSPEPSPSTSSQTYSGGSKAPEGEYRPADEQGPAQNVAPPVRPEGMNVESEDGLFKFISYWNDCVNYGIQTGNFTYARPMVSDDYTQDLELYEWAEGVYDLGGWVAGGRREVVLGDGLLVHQGDGVYTWGGNLNVEDMQAFIGKPGVVIDGSYTHGKGVYYRSIYQDGNWKIDAVVYVEGQ